MFADWMRTQASPAKKMRNETVFEETRRQPGWL
jgi:hypothetical protein